MSDPGERPNPCPAAVAAATIAICRHGGYRRPGGGSATGALRVALARERLAAAGHAARTLTTPHTALPPVQAAAATDHACQITLFQGGAFEAAKWLLVQNAAHGEAKELQPLVLDFASDSEPGGGWKGKQRGTQEEALCRQSNLGVCLDEHFGRTGAAAYMPHMSLIYLPHIVVIRASERENYRLLPEPFWVSVIAGALRSTNSADIHSKVDGLFRTAVNEGHRSIVLGAWGCGAFGNDVADVASIMVQAARAASGCMDHVVFALPRNDEKYRAFLAAAPEAVLAAPQPAAGAELGPGTEQDAPMWEVLAGFAELRAALHADTMTLAAQRAGVDETELLAPQGAKQVAQRWLDELIAVCIEEVAESSSASIVSTLSTALHSPEGSNDAEPCAQFLQMREEFMEVARALVKQHFLARRRSQCPIARGS